MSQTRFESFIETRIYPFIGVMDKLSWIVLFVLMVMTATDLFLRNFTNTSILGSVELTELMMVVIVFCALAQCEISDGHIRIELVMEKFSPKARLYADTLTQAICTLTFALMSTSIFHHAVGMKKYGEVTMDLNLSLYPYVYIASFGCIMMTLVLLFKTIINILKVVNP